MSVKASHKATHQEAEGMAYVPFEKVLIADWDDMDASRNVYFPIDAGTFIYRIVARCLETVAGGTPAFNLGDSDAADTFIADGDTMETAGDIFLEDAPKFYAVADYLVANFQVSVSGGIVELRVMYSGKEG